MIINNWYVAAESKDVSASVPLAVKMLGCDFVLYRTEKGNVVCHSNVCCHRGASLSHGKVEGNCVACPFHGWQFDETGTCVAIPSMGPEFNIPKRARVDTYPVVEKYGLVWTFLGDLPEEVRPPVPELLDEYHQTDTWRSSTLSYVADVNWTKSEENSIDTAHLSFVHSTFGSRQDPRATIVPIERKPYGGRVERERTAPRASQKSGALGKILSAERAKNKVSLEFSLVGVCHRIHPEFRPGVSIVTFGASTPIDPWSTRIFGIQARNFDIDPSGDAERIKGRLSAVEEDLSVTRPLRPRLGPTPMKNEVLVEADQMETLFRQYTFRLIKKGWELDYKKMQEDYDHKVYVIPSPARREDPKGWAHEVAPTTHPRSKEDGWPVDGWLGKVAAQ